MTIELRFFDQQSAVVMFLIRKTLCFLENPTEEESRHFENEMSILKCVKPHPNVVRFIGCVTHPAQKRKIVMEYCKFGDLQKFLNNVSIASLNPCYQHRK